MEQACKTCFYENESITHPVCGPCFGSDNWRPKEEETPEVEEKGEQQLSLPDDDKVRLDYPMFDGLLAYFPNALAEVSKVSKIGNDQHNPGQPMHWDRSKSQDHENKILRHLTDVGKKDGRGVRHSVRLAWRALALAQEELEREEGLPPSRASTNRGW